MAQRAKGVSIRGCFIQAYENGGAVHNRSHRAVTITLPEMSVAVSTGKYDYIHKVRSMDGEFFLTTLPGPCPPTRVAHNFMG